MPLPAVLHCQLPNCLLRLEVAFVWHSSGPQDGATGLKHHGSEGRIGPAAGSPECQTLLLNCLETSFRPSIACFPALPAPHLLASSCSWLSSCTAPVKGHSRRAQTPGQWRTDRACGRQPRVFSCTASSPLFICDSPYSQFIFFHFFFTVFFRYSAVTICFAFFPGTVLVIIFSKHIFTN